MRNNRNIVLYTQDNKGPSAARNKGIDMAKGDIIAFVDSDDYVNNGYLSKLGEIFENSNADVVFFEFNRVQPNGEIISIHKLPDLKDDYYCNLIELTERDIFGYTWIKAFRKEIIGTIRFDETIKLFEDEIFSCQVLKETVNLVLLHEVLYNYVRDNNTLANKTNIDYVKINDYVWNAWEDLLRNSSFKNEVLQNKANHMANNCKWYMLDRNVKFFDFYIDLANSRFIKVTTVSDWFICAIKRKRLLMVAIYYFYYKIKLCISKIYSHFRKA